MNVLKTLYKATNILITLLVAAQEVGLFASDIPSLEDSQLVLEAHSSTEFLAVSDS